MAKHEEGVLARWSRLKREQGGRRAALPPEEAPAGAPRDAGLDGPAGTGNAVPGGGGAADAVPGRGAEAAAEESEVVRLEDLPDIESLTYESDFTVFMAKGVPKALRNQALKKLWRSNPVLANLDGLNDYDLDYRPSEIKALAARAAEDLLRGTKWRTARDQAGEAPAAARPRAEPPAAMAQEPPAEVPRRQPSTVADATPPDAPAGGPPRRADAS